jgi:hypothetical protein
MTQPRYDATLNQYVYGDSPDSDVAQLIDGAITHVEGVHALTKATPGAYTLAAPTAAEEGMRLSIVSRTAQAHVLTVTGGLGGNAADDVLTFAKVGDGIDLLADNLKWVPSGAPYGVVIS